MLLIWRELQAGQYLFRKERISAATVSRAYVPFSLVPFHSLPEHLVYSTSHEWEAIASSLGGQHGFEQCHKSFFPSDSMLS
jgi:hypothetical protein